MTARSQRRESPRPERVSLLVTCLADQLVPRVGTATVEVLERLGLTVDFPASQTCCGQPAYNAGFPDEARTVARRFLSTFKECECVVAPSGSCTAFVRNHMPRLFETEPDWRARAVRVASRTYELSEFLVRVLGVEDVGAFWPARVAYHASCHLLRELGLRDEPIRLLSRVRGLTLVPLTDAERCCGFGGIFSVKQPELSGALLADKLANVAASGADFIVTCDPGCLINMGGGLSRLASPVKAVHLAEILARKA